MMIDLRVKATVWEAPNILSYELRAANGHELPRFTAGAHIDLKLGNGMVRSYSLINSSNERHRYVIAVQKDKQSRGGSKWLHQTMRTGELLSASKPQNHFALDDSAVHSTFIAGGIGITPILSMIDQLDSKGREWSLFYCTRTRNSTAFLEKLEKDPRVHLNFDQERGGAMLDLQRTVGSVPPTSHLYCCGPEPMLEAFRSATKSIDAARVHFEYFSSSEPPATTGGFSVRLERSNREIEIPPGKTILAALLDAGIDVQHSCSEGVCGTCETRVLEGIPDHRDRILTDTQRAGNQTIMVCCSGSKSEKLVLDL